MAGDGAVSEHRLKRDRPCRYPSMFVPVNDDECDQAISSW